ncbi:hypothetical protein I7I51_00736 [Histoplasma capsulatum]|uniref:Uncharacterized protein n=1 Tax=Ajellomyces capsulatus TaxID=5037 RepID=A0A8A1MHT6_AJECA|nr:predicted protein [Histoplasma mississippiense (nom. inval.)]EDN09072.1 predicted protein [Histoplasma mississippiense (nom. inval.)]QSS63677.1 hypothetical protein I7I51_00736 [Histoplasma capsulatum]
MADEFVACFWRNLDTLPKCYGLLVTASLGSIAFRQYRLQKITLRIETPSNNLHDGDDVTAAANLDAVIGEADYVPAEIYGAHSGTGAVYGNCIRVSDIPTPNASYRTVLVGTSSIHVNVQRFD